MAVQLSERMKLLLASYDGNADGQPIYPNEIDHGYAKPIEGDTGVMKQLVKNLRHEQGLRHDT